LNGHRVIFGLAARETLNSCSTTAGVPLSEQSREKPIFLNGEELAVKQLSQVAKHRTAVSARLADACFCVITQAICVLQPFNSLREPILSEV